MRKGLVSEFLEKSKDDWKEVQKMVNETIGQIERLQDDDEYTERNSCTSQLLYEQNLHNLRLLFELMKDWKKEIRYFAPSHSINFYS